jgi:hypothetical protein
LRSIFLIQQNSANKESAMKFTTAILASAFVVSGTCAFAQGYGNPNGSPTSYGSLSGTGPSTFGGSSPGMSGSSARRYHRQAAYGYGPGDVGAGVVAGAAAVGTAAAVAATSPGWGWGGSPYYGGGGYYAGGPYYQPGVLGARAAYYGGGGGPYYQPGGWGAVNSSDYAQYIKNLHDAGYDPKGNFNANGTIKTQ